MAYFEHQWRKWGASGSRILIVDDDPHEAKFVGRMLSRAGAGEIRYAQDPASAVMEVRAFRPDIAIVDYRIPPFTGLEVVEALRHVQSFPEELTVVMLTGSRDPDIREQALTQGVADFVLKEADPAELLLRVGNALRIHHLVLHTRSENERLEKAVGERTEQLQQASYETFERLTLAAALRDDDTADHTRRVGRLASLIARKLGEGVEESRRLGRAARLHDIGKIGVPDSILRKPDKLTAEEYDIMKEHTTVGAKLLEGCQDPLLRMAQVVALNHHERWDGKGYPRGLSGCDIPLVGRIVAVADAFDAMTKDRPYRRAMPPERAIAILQDGMGTQWDPEIVTVFLRMVRYGTPDPVRVSA